MLLVAVKLVKLLLFSFFTLRAVSSLSSARNKVKAGNILTSKLVISFWRQDKLINAVLEDKSKAVMLLSLQ